MTRQCCVKLFKDLPCLFEPFFIAHSLETRHQVILLFRLMRPGLTKRAIEDCIASHCGDTLVLALYQFSEALDGTRSETPRKRDDLTIFGSVP